MDSLRIVILFLWISLSIIYLPFTYLIYRYRHIPPIQGRMPMLVLILNISLYFLSLNEVFLSVWIESYPQFLHGLLGFLPQVTTFIIFTYRLLHLLFSYKITIYISKNHEQHRKETFSSPHQPPVIRTPSVSWYLNNRWLISKNVQLIFLLLQNILLILFWCLIAHYNPTVWRGFGWWKLTNKHVFDIFWNIISSLLCIYALLSVFLGWKLRHCVGDIFRLKLEVTVTGYIGAGAVLVGWICYNFGVNRVYSAVSTLICIHVFFFLTNIWPYLLVKKELQIIETKAKRGKERDIELIDVLQTKAGYEAFFNYLQREFSSENLIFWEQVESLKTVEDPEVLRENVISIFNTFIAPNSQCVINIPFEIRDTICQYMEALEENFHDVMINPKESMSSHILLLQPVPLTPTGRRIPAGTTSLTLPEEERPSFTSFGRDNSGDEFRLGAVVPTSASASSTTTTTTTTNATPPFVPLHPQPPQPTLDLRTIMDLAQKNVYQSMSNDSFLRFQGQPGMKELIQGLELGRIEV